MKNMMTTEISAAMSEPGRLIELSNKIKYKCELNSEDRDITRSIKVAKMVIGA